MAVLPRLGELAHFFAVSRDPAGARAASHYPAHKLGSERPGQVRWPRRTRRLGSGCRPRANWHHLTFVRPSSKPIARTPPRPDASPYPGPRRRKLGARRSLNTRTSQRPSASGRRRRAAGATLPPSPAGRRGRQRSTLRAPSHSRRGPGVHCGRQGVQIGLGGECGQSPAPAASTLAGRLRAPPQHSSRACSAARHASPCVSPAPAGSTIIAGVELAWISAGIASPLWRSVADAIEGKSGARLRLAIGLTCGVAVILAIRWWANR